MDDVSNNNTIQKNVNPATTTKSTGIITPKNNDTITEQAAKEVESRLSKLRGLSDARQGIPLWKENLYPHRVLHWWAKETPQKTAIEYWHSPEKFSACVSYGELDEISRYIAGVIVSMGLNKVNTTSNDGEKKDSFGNSVAVLFIPRGIELVIAILASLNSGMGFTIIDTDEMSIDRLDYIYKDTNASLLLTSHHANDCPLNVVGSSHRLYIDDLIRKFRELKAKGADLDYTFEQDKVSQNDLHLGLVVYTSGSTGQPKGVGLQLRALSNYICIEPIIAGVTPKDRIVQTQSLAFISGLGETFRALISGATLVIGGTEIRRLGPDFLPWMNLAGITVLKAVPSFCRTLISPNPPKLDTLRIMIVSGEALTPEIVMYFSPHVLFLHTYGPCEVCSNCTFTFIPPSKANQISIGKAYPSYTVVLLDDKLFDAGEGEICAAGISISTGYLNLPESTAQRFVTHPKYGRIYRTGDVGRYLPDGSIQYVGRNDSQVKVNGYRIELGEVEARMLLVQGVKEAAVIYKNQKIHGFIVLHPEGIPDFPKGKNINLSKFCFLLHKAGLGKYAMPASITVVDSFPKTVSGKVDRKVLVPKEELDVVAAIPENTISDTIVNAFARVLNVKVLKDSNFFDLGGDSSGAGKVISQLRNSGKDIFKLVSVKDLYANPTPVGLSKLLEDRVSLQGKNGSDPITDPISDSGQPYSVFHAWWISVVQFITIVFELTIDGALLQAIVWPVLEGRTPLFTLAGISVPTWGPGSGYQYLIPIHGVLLFCLYLSLSIAIVLAEFIILFVLKWTLIGKYEPGTYTSRWFFVRHWIVEKFNKKFPWYFFMNGPFGLVLYRLLGAKVGSRVTLLPDSKDWPCGWDLLEFDDDSVINCAMVCPIMISSAGVTCGKIKLGARAAVQPRAILVGGNTLSDDAELGCLSCIEENVVVPPGEYWSGSPARKTSPPPRDLNNVKGTKWGYWLFQFVRLVIYLFSLTFFGIPAGIYLASLIWIFDGKETHFVYLTLNASSIVFGVLFGFILPPLVIRFLTALSPTEPGTYHQWSWAALNAQLKETVFSIPTQGLLNNTPFLVHWMRACGCKIGDRSEMSKVKGAVPELLDLGDESFFTNYTYLGTPEIVNKKYMIGGVKTGNQVLVGNRSVLPINTVLADDTIIGVLSLPPAENRILITDDSDYVLTDDDTSAQTTKSVSPKPHVTWVGNPPYQLRHALSDPYPFPTPKQLTDRYIWGFIAIIIPLLLYFTFSQIWWISYHYIRLAFRNTLPEFFEVLWSSLVMIVTRPVIPFFVALLLHVMLSGGREFKPHQQQYWADFHHRWIIYSKTWAYFVRVYIVKLFNGTIFMNYFLRWTTAIKIGDNTFIASADGFREHDLVRIGSNSIINPNTEFRTHTFENWTLKFEYINIGNGCCVGRASTLMPGCVLEDGAEVGSNTLVMKKETLQSGIFYFGLTAQPMGPSKSVVRRRQRRKQNSGGGETDYVIFKD